MTEVVPPAVDEHGQLVFDVFARACTSRETLEHITGRWGILALAALMDGTFRFNALRRKVDGVSEKMLAMLCTPPCPPMMKMCATSRIRM